MNVCAQKIAYQYADQWLVLLNCRLLQAVEPSQHNKQVLSVTKMYKRNVKWKELVAYFRGFDGNLALNEYIVPKK